MEELRCKTTAADLCNWLVGYLKAKGYPTYAIKTADTWQVGPSAWAEGVTWIGPSRRADVHVRITTLEPELIEVAGEEAIDSARRSRA